MKIIIIGGGTIGSAICSQLVQEGHDLTIVDTDQNILNEISNICDTIGLLGNGADVSILREAGAEKAELLIALTQSDEINILACAAAKKLGTNHTIARVRNPEYSELMRLLQNEMRLSLTINPDLAVAKAIYRMFRFPAAAKIDTFCHGTVEFAEFLITKDSKICGLELSYIQKMFSRNFLICAVLRGDYVYIPSGDFCLQENDTVCLVASEEDLPHLLKSIGLHKDPVRNVLIAGGGRTTYYLMSMLRHTKIKTKIIEKDKNRCLELAKQYSCPVICDNGTKQDLLLEEDLEYVDAFLALSDSDEENVIVSMYAKTIAQGKIITRINSMTYAEIFKEIGLDGIVSPQNSTVSEIIRYVRSLANAYQDETSEIESLHRFMDDRLEVLEFSIKKEIEGLTDIPLRILPAKKGFLITCIVRNNRIIIPSGEDRLLTGDKVIVVTPQGLMKGLKDILH
ncbi:MAG: Trk system potassium transporter TrkA [Ruminococcaceae bacterium]|nr:Trk system potassium transporter TrkA [Oscillospiraceae bacterium]